MRPLARFEAKLDRLESPKGCGVVTGGKAATGTIVAEGQGTGNDPGFSQLMTNSVRRGVAQMVEQSLRMPRASSLSFICRTGYFVSE